MVPGGGGQSLGASGQGLGAERWGPGAGGEGDHGWGPRAAGWGQLPGARIWVLGAGSRGRETLALIDQNTVSSSVCDSPVIWLHLLDL